MRRPIEPLSEADRALVRRVIDRVIAEPVPVSALTPLQEIAMRYERHLEQIEREILRRGQRQASIGIEELLALLARGFA